MAVLLRAFRTCARAPITIGDLSIPLAVCWSQKKRGDAARLQVGDVAFRFRRYHTHQCNMPVLHNDMERRNRLQRVARQGGVRVHGLVDDEAQPVVIRREGQNLYVVVDPFRSFNAFRRGFARKLSPPTGFVPSVSRCGKRFALGMACK